MKCSLGISNFLEEISSLSRFIDRVPDELWTEIHDIVQETGTRTFLKKKKCEKAKWLSEEALQIAVKRRNTKSKGGKERYTHVNVEFQRIARRDKKAFLKIKIKKKRKKKKKQTKKQIKKKPKNKQTKSLPQRSMQRNRGKQQNGKD